MASRLDSPIPTPSVDLDDQSSPSFAELGVPKALCEVLAQEGIEHPFPIQTATLPDSLAGRDVLGRGRTGSGKTLAFALPVIARLSQAKEERRSRAPRALILAPTRELVLQIQAALDPLAKVLSLRTMSIFGGVNQNPQVNKLRQGVDIVVACPGRLEDLLQQKALVLDAIEITVLDEADHMADLGFLPPVKRLMDRTPKNGQRMLFSATLDKGIDVLVKRYLSNPITHSVDSEQSPVATMDHHVLHVSTKDRLPILVDLTSAPGRTMVFTRTKHRAKQLTKQLNESGVPAVEMHGNLSQGARVKNLAAFSEGRAVALVATDIAARGIHVDDVTLVIHADPPTEHKAYLHRSGRTARAGNEGTVATLATETERLEVASLTRKAGIKPKVTETTPGHAILQDLAPGARKTHSAEEISAFLPPTVQGGSARSGGAGASRQGRRSSASKTGSNASRSRNNGSGAEKQGSRRSGTSSGANRSHRSAGRSR
jgi:superfamily II DNA/RNA helicase